MFRVAIIFFITVQSSRSYSGKEKYKCDAIFCSNVIDPVCGMSTYPDRTTVLQKYQNICHLKKAKCRLMVDGYTLNKIPDKICGISKPVYKIGGRRIYDFGIVGAHQACNHTCPTYCIDTYEPACAQIWKPGMKSYSYRPMINHCHIDLFSCALAVNVTIHPLGKCYKNSAGLMFMAQVAALKSLDLLGDPDEHATRNPQYRAHSALQVG